MQNDNYVIDEKRGQTWNNPSEAAKWYAEQLDSAQAALTELMTMLPELVRIADRKGVDLSEERWLDRARTYIDIYEGRTNG